MTGACVIPATALQAERGVGCWGREETKKPLVGRPLWCVCFSPRQPTPRRNASQWLLGTFCHQKVQKIKRKVDANHLPLGSRGKTKKAQVLFLIPALFVVGPKIYIVHICPNNLSLYFANCALRLTKVYIISASRILYATKKSPSAQCRR